jgi:hypothetical protein
MVALIHDGEYGVNRALWPYSSSVENLVNDIYCWRNFKAVLRSTGNHRDGGDNQSRARGHRSRYSPSYESGDEANQAETGDFGGARRDHFDPVWPFSATTN